MNDSILDFRFWILDSGLAAFDIGKGEMMKPKTENLLPANPKSKI
jgi:hypothetical protein